MSRRQIHYWNILAALSSAFQTPQRIGRPTSAQGITAAALKPAAPARGAPDPTVEGATAAGSGTGSSFISHFFATGRTNALQRNPTARKPARIYKVRS